MTLMGCTLTHLEIQGAYGVIINVLTELIDTYEVFEELKSKFLTFCAIFKISHFFHFSFTSVHIDLG